MTARTKMVKEIIAKIDKIPDHELEKVLSYIQKVEHLSENKRAILSFAGLWKDLDQSLFSELTEDLHSQRVKESDTSVK